MSWLSNHDIERAIHHHADDVTRRAFLGVLPLDALPRKVEQRPAFLIVNTQTSDLPGNHWLCLLLFDDGRGEIFNSSGQPPPTAIAQWMNEMCRVWTYNSEQYQSFGSAMCGAYCIFVVLNRLQHSSLSQTLRPFSTSLASNDVLMTRYYRRIKQNL